MSKFFIGFFVVLSLFSLTACNRNKTLAEVGSEKIEKKDVALRVKGMMALSGKIDDKTALEQLINDFTLAEVIKKKGDVNLDSLVEEEMKKMSEGNMDASPLPRLKPIFGEDTASLKRIFVLPMVVSRLAFTEGYLKDEEFHRAKKQQAEEFLAEALKKPAAFEELAGKSGIHFQKAALTSSQGLVWSASADTSLLPSGPKIAEAWKKATLDSTPAGKIAPHLVEEDRAWVILKNLGTSPKEKGTTEIVVGIVSKEPFGKWLERQKETVSVKRTTPN